MRRNWMPLYIPDFLTDTVHLSAAETGAYLCLIMHYWMHDGLPDDDHKLAQIARMPVKSWRQTRPTIEAFFHDGWRHKRIDAELGKMVGLMERRRAAGSKGGTASTLARWNGVSKRQANVKQTDQQTLSKPPSKTEANVNHTTQEDITSTFVGAARARENPTNSTPETADGPAGSAMEAGGASPGISQTEELALIMKKRGWV
jgi:uncharacterized protein YdaU (DUF1376 family)